jgi:hypothetical protein
MSSPQQVLAWPVHVGPPIRATASFAALRRRGCRGSLHWSGVRNCWSAAKGCQKLHARIQASRPTPARQPRPRHPHHGGRPVPFGVPLAPQAGRRLHSMFGPDHGCSIFLDSRGSRVMGTTKPMRRKQRYYLHLLRLHSPRPARCDGGGEGGERQQQQPWRSRSVALWQPRAAPAASCYLWSCSAQRQSGQFRAHWLKRFPAGVQPRAAASHPLLPQPPPPPPLPPLPPPPPLPLLLSSVLPSLRAQPARPCPKETRLWAYAATPLIPRAERQVRAGCRRGAPASRRHSPLARR